MATKQAAAGADPGELRGGDSPTGWFWLEATTGSSHWICVAPGQGPWTQVRQSNSQRGTRLRAQKLTLSVARAWGWSHAGEAGGISWQPTLGSQFSAKPGAALPQGTLLFPPIFCLVFLCSMCVCVCVCERERERERETHTHTSSFYISMSTAISHDLWLYLPKCAMLGCSHVVGLSGCSEACKVFSGEVLLKWVFKVSDLKTSTRPGCGLKDHSVLSSHRTMSEHFHSESSLW